MLLALGLGAINTPDAVLLALVLITGVKGCNAGGGYQLNALDISPKLAGFTHGVMNSELASDQPFACDFWVYTS